jgi:hypothetical protein
LQKAAGSKDDACLKKGSVDDGCVDSREHRRRLQTTAGRRDAICLKNSCEQRHRITTRYLIKSSKAGIIETTYAGRQADL